MTGAIRIGLVLAAMAVPQAPAAPVVDRERLMGEVTRLSAPDFEGRAAGSPGGIRARRWLVDQFSALGLRPLGKDFQHPFSVDGRQAANLLGVIDGRQPEAHAFVITAHYDHLGVKDGAIYHGADDNASGVAGLLAVARYFVKQPPRHPFIVAALDAEESGQRGSRHLFASRIISRETVALNVNLDMLSRSATRELFAAGTFHYPQLLPALRQVQQRSPVSLRFGHDEPKSASGQEDWTRASDHAAFHQAGIPFVYFGVEDHADYHQPTDTADRIDARFFTDSAVTIIDAIRSLDAAIP